MLSKPRLPNTRVNRVTHARNYTLLLIRVGVYGVVASAVERCRAEIAVGLALGTTGRPVLGTTPWQGERARCSSARSPVWPGAVAASHVSAALLYVYARRRLTGTLPQERVARIRVAEADDLHVAGDAARALARLYTCRGPGSSGPHPGTRTSTGARLSSAVRGRTNQRRTPAPL